MKETRNSPNGHAGNKNLIIKAGGAGGIGAVFLFGGALAAAALASAFAVRHKRWSSDEDSSPKINEKSENSKGGDEEVELEHDSSCVISDQSLKLDDEANIETADENDAVSDCGFVIVKEEFPILAVEEDVSRDHSKQGQNMLAEREGDDDDGVIVTRSNEEDAEEKGMQPRQEENSEECHDHENNAVEEVPIDQTKEFEGLCNVNGEINEDKCEEKTVLPQYDGHAVQQDNLVGDEEGVPLSTDGVEMFEVEEKTVEQHKHVCQSDAGQIQQIGGGAKQNHLLDKFMEGENGAMREHMENEGEKVKGVENGEARTDTVNMSKSKWEAIWQEESRKESYEVGGKIQEDRVEQENELMKKEEGAALRRVMIWVVCVVSSLSCSWLLDLSYAKLGLLVLLTLFLLEIYGFSLHKEILAMTKYHATGHI